MFLVFLFLSSIPNTMRELGNTDQPDRKILSPLFPKMHVNDRDQAGGPKPPPRNKMALFEQPAVSMITTPRITSSIGSTTLPNMSLLPSPKYSGIAPSGSSIYYVGGQVPPVAAAAVAERLPLYAQNPVTANTATLPLLPFPMPDGQVALPPEYKISREKKSAQASSIGKVEDRHPELVIFHQVNKGRVDNSTDRHPRMYATQESLLSTRSSTGWQRKPMNHSEGMGSGSSTKSAYSVEQDGSEILKGPPVDDIRSNGVPIGSTKPRKDCEYRLPESRIVCNKKQSRLESSRAECTSTVNLLSPEDVTAIIGEEAFLRLRKEMIKHQKQFAEQVFELHRLIAVHRLIARSRRALVEDKHKLEKPSSSRIFNPKEIQKGQNIESQDGTSRPKPSSTCVTDMFYLPPQRKDLFKVPVPPITVRANQETSAGNPKQTNAGGINNPWIYPPPGTPQHLLVPLFSPSEGFIFKPYPIPSVPSPAAFMPPPIHINPPKTAQTHPPSSPQSGIRPFSGISPCFPPCVTPSLNTVASAFEHVGKAESYHHPNTALPGSSFKSSWNFSTLVSGTVSCNIDATQQAKQGGDSTASSSPPGRAHRNILPLFPEEPTNIAMQNKHHQAQSTEQQQRKVIKAVPHYPTSDAAESARRIIRLIQEERN